MARTDRSRSLERLAKALRPPPVEEFASALQECFDVAVREGAREGAQEAMNRIEPRLDRVRTSTCGPIVAMARRPIPFSPSMGRIALLASCAGDERAPD